MEESREIQVESVSETLISEEELVQIQIDRIREYVTSGEAGAATELFGGLHPADQGEVLIELDVDQREVMLGVLTAEDTAEILEHLEVEDAATVLGGVRGVDLAIILDRTGPDVSADILKQMPMDDATIVLDAMNDTTDVMALLQYAEDTAGGLMTPEFASVREDTSAANALDLLRTRGPRVEDIGSLMVVDGDGRLIGSLSITRLALARPSRLVSEIMDGEVISVPVGTDQEACARLMDRYNLNYLPVLDEAGLPVGLILVEDVVDVLREEATEDMYRISGIGGERLPGPIKNSVLRRLPWLYINLATTFLAALVISVFEGTIEKVVALAVFLPVVAGQGGIGGTQTLTLVVRSMALGEIFGRRGRRILLRESVLGIVHGVLLGIVVGLVAWGWKGNYMLGVILGIAMLGNMLMAGLVGAGVPLLLRRLGLDPAVSSAIFVTTVTDVVGFLLFLGIASALVSYLI